MVAYRGGDSALMERSMDARGRWRPRRLVAGGLPKDIYILLADVNRSGDEVVAWQAFSETGPEPIFAGVRGAGGPFEARRLAPGPNSFDPRVAIGPSGSAVVAWEQGDRGLRVSVGAPGHPFTQPSFLVQPKPGPNGVEGVELAVDRHGRVLLAWKGWRNGHASVLAALRTRRGGVLHYARLVDSDDASVDGQGTAVLDGRARAIVAWRRNNRITAARAFAP